MSQELEEICAHKVNELLINCPQDLVRLLENCYITIYNEELPLPPLFGTVYCPDSKLDEVEQNWDRIDRAAIRIGVTLTYVEISEVFKYHFAKIQQFKKTRPKHYLNFLYLLS